MMAVLERWARAKGLWSDAPNLPLSTRPGWTVQRGRDGTMVTRCAAAGDGSNSRSWHLDAVSAHLWALALEADIEVDCGECSACGGRCGRWDDEAIDQWYRCESCNGIGRDARSLALLVCQARPHKHEFTGWGLNAAEARDDLARQLSSADAEGLVVGPVGRVSVSSNGDWDATVTAVVRDRAAQVALLSWAHLPEHAEARSIVADWRASQTTAKPGDVPAWVREHPERVYLLAPERTADEIGRMTASLVRPALLGDLAWWLRLWLDGAECEECRGTGEWASEPPRGGEFEGLSSSGPCFYCWGTGSVGHAQAMTAAVRSWTGRRNKTPEEE